MAAQKYHLLVSSALGVGYAVAVDRLGVHLAQGALAGGLCALAGLLPNLDKTRDKLVQALFGLTAVVVPLLQLRRWHYTGLGAEEVVLLVAASYLAIGFGAACLFQRLTVHRGMCHSFPAAVIAAEIVFLAYDGPDSGCWVLAAAVLLGFLSHLIMDEVASPAVPQQPSASRNAGPTNGLKLVSRSLPATLLTWGVLAALTYLVGIKEGYWLPTHISMSFSPLEDVKR